MTIGSQENITEQINEINATLDWYWALNESSIDLKEAFEKVSLAKEKAITIEYSFGIARSQMCLANIYIKDFQKFESTSALIKAMKLLKQAIKYFEDEGISKHSSWCHNMIAWIYFYTNDHIKRLKHNLAGYSFAINDPERTYEVIHLNNIVDTYISLNDYKNANIYLDKSLKISPNNAVALIKKGKVKYLQEDFDEAKEYIENALTQFDKRKNVERFYCSANVMLGDIAYEKEAYKTAEKLLKKGLKIADDSNIIEKQIEIHLLLAKVFTAKKNFLHATECYEKYFELRKKLNAESLKNKVQEFEYEEKLIQLNDAFAEVESEKENLKRNNRNLENFAHVASHDMKEPLRMIRSFSQLLERSIDTKIDDNEKEYLGYITNSANRLNILINDILDYSKLTQMKVGSEKIDLNEVFKQILTDFNLNAEKDIDTISIASLPTILGVESAITRLFRNLISNAIKFAKKDEPIKIKVNSTKENNIVTIKIEDNGIGILTDNQSIIFEMFSRLHAKNEYDGSGIGLAACAHIVKMHHGKIWVESEIGEGSTFFVSLPVNPKKE